VWSSNSDVSVARFTLKIQSGKQQLQRRLEDCWAGGCRDVLVEWASSSAGAKLGTSQDQIPKCLARPAKASPSSTSWSSWLARSASASWDAGQALEGHWALSFVRGWKADLDVQPLASRRAWRIGISVSILSQTCSAMGVFVGRGSRRSSLFCVMFAARCLATSYNQNSPKPSSWPLHFAGNRRKLNVTGSGEHVVMRKVFWARGRFGQIWAVADCLPRPGSRREPFWWCWGLGHVPRERQVRGQTELAGGSSVLAHAVKANRGT
jgi:hypothetical protein